MDTQPVAARPNYLPTVLDTANNAHRAYTIQGRKHNGYTQLSKRGCINHIVATSDEIKYIQK